MDAHIISDPDGVLESILEAYRTPKSYEPLFAELRAASAALNHVADTAKYGHRLRRLGIYLLRTSAYAQLASAGRPTFDVSDVARHLGNPEITMALGLRQRELDLMNDLRVLRMAISSLLGGLPENPWGSVEALAVSLSRSHPYAANLLGQTLLASGDSLEYTVLTPPPL
jgi:hypothetical protein